MPQQTQRSKMNTETPNRPVHTVRYGAVKAAVWANQTSKGIMHNVTLVRSYKDGEEWKESGSFSGDDLLAASKALSEAHTWIYAQRTRDAEQV